MTRGSKTDGDGESRPRVLAATEGTGKGQVPGERQDLERLPSGGRWGVQDIQAQAAAEPGPSHMNTCVEVLELFLNLSCPSQWR